jgi:hypothetical protein
MNIVLVHDGILCRHLSVPLDQWCHLVLGFLCWIFCLDVWSTGGDGGVLKSPTTTVLSCICDFKSFSVCLMKLVALTLGACKLIIISSWLIAPFISMNWPSLSLLTNYKFDVHFVWYKYCCFYLF